MKTIIRLVSKEDAESLFALVEAGRERLRPWLPWVDKTTTLRDVEEFVSRVTEERERGESVHFVILDEGEVSGVVGAHRIDEKKRVAEIGYWLRIESEGKGVVTLSCEQLIKVLFESYKIDTIEIRAMTGNERSQNVAAGLGFVKRGIDYSSQYIFTMSRACYYDRNTA